jgi:NADH-ubiquinone oxidoreductase chain 2
MLVLSILFLIASNAVTIRRDMSILYNRTAILILIYSILLNIISLSIINKGIGLHGGLLYVTNFTQVFQIFILIICVLILQITSFYFNKPKAANKTYLTVKQFNMLMLVLKKYINLKNTEHMKIIEYPLILLFVITGAIFLISSYDIISIFLSIELQSYGLYLLSTINRNSELSTTGSLIYFLLGGLSSCLILLGISLLYINSGTTNLDNIYIISIIQDINNNIDNIYKSYYINFSLFIFSIGFLFKISAAPFHF